MQIRTNDTVVVITGKSRGAKGKVLSASPKAGKVVVENVNMVHKHMKPRQQGMQGGVIEREAAMDASNVMLYCPKCDKGVRVGYKVLENNKKVRVCKKCGTTFDE
ncbi:MAG: 50S ribosomal protein L24 [Clostridia bacterium]|nr:50S ribosomal protein L24 [Clostridia bacterium]